MKYIMLMAPESYRTLNGYISRPIVIINNSTAIGRKKASHLMEEEWSYAGSIESDLPVAGLKNGIEAVMEKKYMQLRRDVKESLNLLLNAL